MRSFLLAIHLARIPRLFLTLIFFPLLFGGALLTMQILATLLILRSHPAGDTSKSKVDERNVDRSLPRLILYGSGAPLPPLLVCRWREELGDGVPYELPPSPECAPDLLDVALRVADPVTFDGTEYERLFQGNIERLHIGKYWRDKPHVIIDLTKEEIETHVFSVLGMMVLNLLTQHEAIKGRYVATMAEIQEVWKKFGSFVVHLPGVEDPIQVALLRSMLVVIFNLLGVVVISLWLALKAHRKVLDYFARSGALMPMVAATGSKTFYSALWILTSFRVLAFVGLAVPILVSQLLHLIDPRALDLINRMSPVVVASWLIAIVSSLGLATLVGSIAELKHRHQLLSFTYRWLPLILCSVGALVWLITFLDPSLIAAWIRMAIAATPIIGMVPIVVAPILPPNALILILHALLTLLVFIWALRANARWFAAHLEDL